MKNFISAFCLIVFSSLTQAQTMDFDWVATSSTTSQAHSKGVVKTSDGGVITVGDYRGSSDFDPGLGTSSHTSNGNFDSFVVRLDSNGVFLWDYVFGGPLFTNQRDDQAIFVATDQNDDVYVVGRFYGTVDFDNGPEVHNLTSNGHIDGFLLKLSSGGQFMWVVPIGGTSFDQTTSLHVLNDNSVVVTGTIAGSVDFDPSNETAIFDTGGTLEGYLANYLPDGTFNWLYANEGLGSVLLYELNQYENGNIVACGEYSGEVDLDFGSGTELRNSPSGSQALVMCLTLDGDLVWASEFNTTSSLALVSNIALDENQNLYGGGWFADNISLGGVQYSAYGSDGDLDVYFFQLNEDGQVNWSHHGGSEFGDNIATVIAHPNHGAVILIHVSSADFIFENDIAEGPDFEEYGGLFLLYFDVNGEFVWKEGFEELSYDIEAVITPVGQLYLVGSFHDGQDFDLGPENTNTPCIPGTVDQYTASYHIPVTSTPDGINEIYLSNLSVYPNPANNQLSVLLPDNKIGRGELKIYNIAGQQVMAVPFATEMVNVKSLIPGLYFITVTFNNGMAYSTKFVKE